MGKAAGLPLWDELLASLAAEVGLADAAGLKDLGPLDAAELLRRRAHKAEAKNPEKTLGQLVADIIGRKTRYALSHVLLAALSADEVITTNFDSLFETAVRDFRGTGPIVVLPDSDPSDLQSAAGDRSWLLKLHGNGDDPENIVLARRSFTTYDATRRPLGSVLQATLLTKHLLVVGASMTDDNVIRLVHEVAALHEWRKPGAPVRRLGTVLSLQEDVLRAELWDPELHYVDVSTAGDPAAAARDLEIFLDRVAMLATTSSEHLLDPRYRELLSAGEQEVADAFGGVGVAMRNLATSEAGSPRWQQVARLLAELGLTQPRA